MIHEFSCLGQLPPITQIEQSRSKPLLCFLNALFKLLNYINYYMISENILVKLNCIEICIDNIKLSV